MENNERDHTADLIIGAFFFTMQSYEYTIPKVLGRTIATLRLGGVKFFNTGQQEIDYHDHPQLVAPDFYSC